MTVNFMGLTGPVRRAAVLLYASSFWNGLRAKDPTLLNFLDIFNHRMISFFYRAWEKYRFPVTYCLGR